jgi:hypothetical protein
MMAISIICCGMSGVGSLLDPCQPCIESKQAYLQAEDKLKLLHNYSKPFIFNSEPVGF